MVYRCAIYIILRYLYDICVWTCSLKMRFISEIPNEINTWLTAELQILVFYCYGQLELLMRFQLGGSVTCMIQLINNCL